jgi:hypothetical protein
MRSAALWWKGLRSALGRFAQEVGQGARGCLGRWRERPERPWRAPYKRLSFEVVVSPKIFAASSE